MLLSSFTQFNVQSALYLEKAFIVKVYPIDVTVRGINLDVNVLAALQSVIRPLDSINVVSR